jgi:glycosyltransferase involved in cell wall biosynthesis
VWADSAEQTYLMVADRICVGSEYHKKLVMDYFNIPSEKIFVTGCVWNNDYAYGLYPHKEPKMDWVIYPHRICNEKGFNEFIEIATKTPETHYLITSSNKNRKDIQLPKNVLYQHGLTKQEYYKALSKSKYYLSTAHQETFGYTLREALLYGCIPIVPNRAAYKESVPKENRYDTILEAINLLQTAQPVSNDYVEMFNNNAKKIIEVCTGKATGMEKK